MFYVGILLVHHVQVGLEDSGRSIFPSGRSRLLDHHVSGAVNLVFQTVPFCYGRNVGPDLVLFFRTPWDGEDLVEMGPEGFGFEIGNERHVLLLSLATQFLR